VNGALPSADELAAITVAMDVLQSGTHCEASAAAAKISPWALAARFPELDIDDVRRRVR
jgi:hypothetical protein